MNQNLDFVHLMRILSMRLSCLISPQLKKVVSYPNVKGILLKSEVFDELMGDGLLAGLVLRSGLKDSMRLFPNAYLIHGLVYFSQEEVTIFCDTN